MKEREVIVTIDSFRGKYAFLSNFYMCTISVPVGNETLTFQNTEAAFQAMKDMSKAKEFCGLSPSEAKRKGRRVSLRLDWESVKDNVMRIVLRCKFTQNPELADMLVATGDAELVEGNTWNDRYWGVCDGQGKNKLGQLLMELRTELAQERQSG